MREKVKYKTKKYLHFDDRIGYKSIKSYVTNPNKISKHSFFPLIHYTMNFETYNEDYIDIREDSRPIKEKNRDIMYACHLDNFIYKHYGEILNKNYNNWAIKHKIDDYSIAYRNNKFQKCNIDFAAEVINYISTLKDCFIMIGDFEKFFDCLNHSYLKDRVMDILDIEFLRDDWYKVLKSVTKHSSIQKDLINRKLGTDKEIKLQGRLKYFKSVRDFRKFKNQYNCEKNNDKFGIPQGTAISAVLANVYTTTFDKMVGRIVTKYNGLYRRYSDDFIIVIPKFTEHNTVDSNNFNDIVKLVLQNVKREKLHIQTHKTEIYEFSNGKINNPNNKTSTQIDYLGFVFDGRNVRMRNKSPYKFYRKAYKQISKAKKTKVKKGLKRLPYRRKIYRLYTDLGVHNGDFGNFITYAMKSKKTFDQISPNTNNLMMQQIKNRKKKIEKRIGYNLNS